MSKSLFAFIKASTTSIVLDGGTLLSIAPWVISNFPFKSFASN